MFDTPHDLLRKVFVIGPSYANFEAIYDLKMAKK